MPEWRVFLRDRLSLPPGAEHRADEVIEEVAQELDEIYRAELAGGASDAAATAAALRELGDTRQLADGCAILAQQAGLGPARAFPAPPDAGTTRRSWMAGFSQDLRHGWRMLRWQPGFAAAAIVTMALGIGAATAVFSIVNSVLLRPLPFPEADRLVRFENGEFGAYSFAGPEFFDYRDRQHGLESFAVYMVDTGTLTGRDRPVRISAVLASSDFFRVFGVKPIHGRTFASGEDRPGISQVVVLRHGFWRNRFGGDPGIVGQTVTIEGLPHTVIGIMPPGFGFPSDRVDVWVPFGIDRAAPGPRTSHRYFAIGRLRQDRTLAQASAGVRQVARQLMEEHPAAYTREFKWDVHLRSLHDATVSSARPALLVLSGAVALTLLLACANVANLLLARGASRRREIALRAALGASRAQIVRQLLTESVLLSSAGGVLGLGLAYAGLRAVVALEPGSVPRLQEAAVDGTVLAVAAGTAVLTGFLFGIVPACYAVPKNLCQALRDNARATPSSGRRRVGDVLVGAEMALTLVLLVGAGLLARSFVGLLAVDLGFSPRNVFTFSLDAEGPRHGTHEQRVLFFRQLLTRLGGLPGVQTAGAVSQLPLTMEFSNGFVMVEGKPVSDAALELPWGFVNAGWRNASPGYIPALGIPLVAGRQFHESDAAGASPVIIVDDQFAKEAWPRSSPIGKRVAVVTQDGSPAVWRTVVGVVRHVRELGPARRNLPQTYFPFAQRPFGAMYVTIAAAGPVDGLLDSVQREVSALDPTLPIDDAEWLEDRLARSLAAPRFTAQVMGVFSLLALALSAVGLAGVVAHAVSRRTREIGVRLAMGATQAQVLRLILGQGLRLTAVGLAVGLAGAWMLSRFLVAVLFGVSATDPATYFALAGVLLVVAALASYVPARRATRVDPIATLRAE